MVPIAETADPEDLERWSFALAALDIPFELTPADEDEERVRLWVRREHAAEAHRTVVELDVEALPGPAPVPAAELPRHPHALPWALAMGWGVVGLSLAGLSGRGWTLAGRVDGERLFSGEGYRAITAVTLHADLGHLLGNGLLGVVLGAAAVARVGPGVTALVALAAGALANVGSAALHGPDFRSLGASGAVFALLGLIASVAVRTSVRTGWRRWLPGVGAAAAVFAWMGVAPGTDMVAHLSGCAFGFGAGFFVPLAGDIHARADRRLQQLAGAVAVAAVLVAWTLALT